MTQRGKTRLKIWLVVVGIFALGCVTGASLDSAYRLRALGQSHAGDERRDSKKDAFEKMRRDLDLSEQQAAQIGAIVEQTRNEYRALRAEVRPRYNSLRQNSRAKIRALLTPEQQKRFDEKVAERDARREQDERDKK
jgi:Spy/CpxP family protein refolding chaperone